MPKRPNIRAENDPVKRMRELREFCLANAPKGYWAKHNHDPFAVSQWSWDFRAHWDDPESTYGRTIVKISFDVREKKIDINWSEDYERHVSTALWHAKLIHDVACFINALSEFWSAWNTKYWPQKPGRRIVEALADEGVSHA